MGLTPFIPPRKFSLQHKDTSSSDDNTSSNGDNTWMSDSDDSTENGNENYWQFSYMLFTPTLEDLKNVLSTALSPFFEEFEIAVVSCPCLTRAPYNLAAAGLSGNTGILEVGELINFYPRPQIHFVRDIKDILSTCSCDAFVIGSGFAAKPAMPYNGHLTMNAVVSANPRNVINNSRIAYEFSFNDLKCEIVKGQDQIKCCLFGHFFFSGGKQGPVIKMRAKGRRSRSYIIALIQAALTNLCQNQTLIGLGIVLVLNGGLTDQRLLPHDFVSYDYNEVQDYYNPLTSYESNCKNLIALGSLISDRLGIFQINNVGAYLRDSYSTFNAFCNSNTGGEFFNDITPEETEYIVYINIAQESCYNC